MGKPLSQGVNPDRLDQLIRDLGVRVRVYKSTLCPNMKSLESLDHNVNCKVCNNNMIDFCPKETLALFQQQDLVEQYKLQGTFSMDEILVSFLSGQTLGHMSKVELLDFQEDFFELVQRQEGVNVDQLKYPACKILGVFTATATTTTQYHADVDFKINVNGNIEWIGAHKPTDRQIYSIYYQHHPVFRAIKAVHRDRYSQYNLRPGDIQSQKVSVGGKTYVKLPETWILKRDYLLERRDRNGNPLPQNEYYDPNEAP